ncbi:hypothetical protein CIK05_14900 [Bdellovibrio sp. qaytius]|nr:hypothetical protein CIK05_14900 [Bdellovibrio sp. qaytius]
MLNLVKNLCIIFIAFAIGLMLYSRVKKEYAADKKHKQDYTRALQVKKELLKYKKPARVEIETFTKRYQDDIEDIKALKLPLDEAANFYMQVQLFSEDTDESSPLILQIKFKDIKTQNLIREDSVNLE